MSGIDILTFGCRLNAYESEVMRSEADAAGLDNVVLVNTCAVTSEAVRQARQAIRKARRENPDARIVVSGCAAQVEPDTFADMPEVDHVIGNDEKTEASTYSALRGDDLERVRVNDIMAVRQTAGHMISGFGTRARAYVQIQNGCDHRCTFCIIPFGRGPSRSVPAGDVVTQIQKLVEAGYGEVVLTGVDITAYGRDLPGTLSLGKLVQKVLDLVPELRRLRLSSIDSIEADAALMDAIANEPRLMPHLHLSLQAGDDLTLKRMKRRHSRGQAIAFCRQVRELRPDMAFGADLIAGFPTESEAMFESTLSIVEECGLTFLHVFPFSPRPGTPAARMPQVERQTIKARAQRLREQGKAALIRHLDAQVGRDVDILCETSDRGRTPQFTPVRLDRGAAAGQVVQAAITGRDDTALQGMPLA